MAEIFQLTDTAAACIVGNYCSGDSSGGGASIAQASIGAAAGTGTTLTSAAGSTNNSVLINYECVVPAGFDINSGSASSVSLDITVANSNITWNDSGSNALSLCRVSSSCTNQQTIDAQNPNISLGTTGLKTFSWTYSGGSIHMNSGDKIICVLSFSNSAMNTQSFTWKHDGTVVFDVSQFTSSCEEPQFLRW